MSETFFVVPVAAHEGLVRTAYQHRGFDAIEAGHAEKIGAAPRGILTDVDRMVRANLGFSN